MPPPTTLAHELGKKRPFDTAEEEAYIGIWRTGAVLDGEVNRLMRGHGLTKTSYNILRILRGAGEAGCNGIEIASMVVADVPDMARLIERLERLDYLRRCKADDDRRCVRNHLTAKGMKVLAALDEPLRALQRRQFAALSRAEMQALSRLLAKIRRRGAE
ncbi:MAG: Transcriptional activatory protein BadR [Planctomycetota bacterium]|jgi:DNA-binding MarR family transcriptional regulator